MSVLDPACRSAKAPTVFEHYAPNIQNKINKHHLQCKWNSIFILKAMEKVLQGDTEFSTSSKESQQLKKKKKKKKRKKE